MSSWKKILRRLKTYLKQKSLEHVRLPRFPLEKPVLTEAHNPPSPPQSPPQITGGDVPSTWCACAPGGPPWGAASQAPPPALPPSQTRSRCCCSLLLPPPCCSSLLPPPPPCSSLLLPAPCSPLLLCAPLSSSLLLPPPPPPPCPFSATVVQRHSRPRIRALPLCYHWAATGKECENGSEDAGFPGEKGLQGETATRKPSNAVECDMRPAQPRT